MKSNRGKNQRVRRVRTRLQRVIAAIVVLSSAGAIAQEPSTKSATPFAPPPLTLVTADGVKVPTNIVSPLGKKMTLKFNDEFDAVADTDGQPYFDRRKWQSTFWQGSGERTLAGNGEAQYYMDKDYAGKNNLALGQRPDPFSFAKPGVLTISAFTVPPNLWSGYAMTRQRHVASGLLISDARFTFSHGYVEGRFKLPANRGAWPAFWLLANDPRLGSRDKAHQWPPEVDIFEYFGHRPATYSVALHGLKGEKSSVGLKYNPVGEDISKDFHTWGFEWDEQTAVFTFDGKEFVRGKTTPSLNRPMYLLINLAVGGTWYSQEMGAKGSPCKPWEVDEAGMPWKMECDFVRVYQQ